MNKISWVAKELEISESECQAIIRDMHRGMRPVAFWEKWIINATYPLWRPVISRFFYALYQQRIIGSSRLHLFNCFFDRTRKDSCLLFVKPKNDS